MVPAYDPADSRMFDEEAVAGYLALMANQLPLNPKGFSRLPIIKILWGDARIARDVRSPSLSDFAPRRRRFVTRRVVCARRAGELVHPHGAAGGRGAAPRVGARDDQAPSVPGQEGEARIGGLQDGRF